MSLDAGFIERTDMAELEHFWSVFCAGSDERGFTPLYERTKPLVYTICRRMLRRPDDVEDAFQGTYARLVELSRRPAQTPRPARSRSPGALPAATGCDWG
jgi:hypothetical protein